MESNEKQTRMLVAQYLQMQYPDVIYRFDLAADLKLTVGQASQHKRLHPQRGFPDLMIFEPRGRCHGLAIELKRPNTRVWKKDGTPASKHIAEQDKMLTRLEEKGYMAVFGVGFDNCRQIIDNYMQRSR